MDYDFEIQAQYSREEKFENAVDEWIDEVSSDIELDRNNAASEVCELLNHSDVHSALCIIARNLTEQYPKDDTPSERLLRALIDGAITDYAERKVLA
jgi:hypothetical protein